MLSVHIIIAPVQCDLSPQLMIMRRRSTRLGESTAAADYSGMIKGGQKGGNEERENRREGWVVEEEEEGGRKGKEPCCLSS